MKNESETNSLLICYVLKLSLHCQTAKIGFCMCNRFQQMSVNSGNLVANNMQQFSYSIFKNANEKTPNYNSKDEV